MSSLFNSPRMGEKAFREAVQRELPGCKFEMRTDNLSYMVEMRITRAVEGISYAVSDELMFDQNALSRTTIEAIDRIRRKAIDDYGIEAIIEEERKKASIATRKLVMEELLMKIEKRRETISVLDEDGNVKFVPGDLPWELQGIADWARR